MRISQMRSENIIKGKHHTVFQLRGDGKHTPLPASLLASGFVYCTRVVTSPPPFLSRTTLLIFPDLFFPDCWVSNASLRFPLFAALILEEMPNKLCYISVIKARCSFTFFSLTFIIEKIQIVEFFRSIYLAFSVLWRLTCYPISSVP